MVPFVVKFTVEGGVVVTLVVMLTVGGVVVTLVVMLTVGGVVVTLVVMLTVGGTVRARAHGRVMEKARAGRVSFIVVVLRVVRLLKVRLFCGLEVEVC